MLSDAASCFKLFLALQEKLKTLKGLPEKMQILCARMESLSAIIEELKKLRNLTAYQSQLTSLHTILKECEELIDRQSAGIAGRIRGFIGASDTDQRLDALSSRLSTLRNDLALAIAGSTSLGIQQLNATATSTEEGIRSLNNTAELTPLEIRNLHNTLVTEILHFKTHLIQIKNSAIFISKISLCLLGMYALFQNESIKEKIFSAASYPFSITWDGPDAEEVWALFIEKIGRLYESSKYLLGLSLPYINYFLTFFFGVSSHICIEGTGHLGDLLLNLGLLASLYFAADRKIWWTLSLTGFSYAGLEELDNFRQATLLLNMVSGPGHPKKLPGFLTSYTWLSVVSILCMAITTAAEAWRGTVSTCFSMLALTCSFLLAKLHIQTALNITMSFDTELGTKLVNSYTPLHIPLAPASLSLFSHNRDTSIFFAMGCNFFLAMRYNEFLKAMKSTLKSGSSFQAFAQIGLAFAFISLTTTATAALINKLYLSNKEHSLRGLDVLEQVDVGLFGTILTCGFLSYTDIDYLPFAYLAAGVSTGRYLFTGSKSDYVRDSKISSVIYFCTFGLSIVELQSPGTFSPLHYNIVVGTSLALMFICASSTSRGLAQLVITKRQAEIPATMPFNSPRPC